jgi:hypothetical protein
MLDWTMVGNAENPFERISTLLYLFLMRYKFDPKEAASAVHSDIQKYGEPKFPIIQEITLEINSPTNEFKLLHSFYGEKYLRSYLSNFLVEYNFLAPKSKTAKNK